MKTSITPFLLFLFILISTEGLSQDDRNFWQKIFGKKSEKIDVEEPKNSQDSLALLLNNHLGNKSEDTTSEKIKNEPTDYNATKPLKTGDGVLTVHMDDNITNWLDSVKTQDIIGFRIQVFMGDLTEARSIRSAMLSAGERATLDYNSSDYYVRIGDYRNYISAEKRLNSVKEIYPSAYVVKDKIRLK